MQFLCEMLGGLLFLFVVIRMLPSPPRVSSQEELKNEGLSPKEIRRELRAQRAEHRSYERTLDRAFRTGSRAGRAAGKSLK